LSSRIQPVAAVAEFHNPSRRSRTHASGGERHQ
jgi:hypothetical protein